MILFDNNSLDKLTNDIQKTICPKKSVETGNLLTITFIKYKGKYIVLYGSNDAPLFDIQHVLGLMNYKSMFLNVGLLDFLFLGDPLLLSKFWTNCLSRKIFKDLSRKIFIIRI